MKTWSAKPDSVEKKWWVVDAEGVAVGRLATNIANILRGKHRPTFTPHMDTGDFVVVINADKMTLSGTKWQDKRYYRRSAWLGSAKERSVDDMLKKDPGFVIKEAVQGMLPKNRLSRQLIKKLKAYSGAEHPHTAQKPEALSLN
jgi:large subunit ribosomal protein L13